MNTTKKPEQMSTTRKIEGWVDADADFFDGHMQFWQTRDRSTPDMATLIIGGKGWTEEEVKAMVKEMIEAVSAGEELTQESIAAKHGIKL